ncbi:DUF1636 domain-containing protein [Novosphingobium sp. ERW19]|uniref:DUF1636 domain-containing protein n=1 Tax=Novosphingobium sp. ERW19 TaxID=2726186 RepID=UPI001457100A|nr:DUF1636 domain-containing protein [Novosphingobium sp. ERW19]NLR40523.1 DUF1636 domain-containing protein [Novosphingobium sp. ERW19]
MLRAIEPGPAVVVCSTCRLSADQREDTEGQRGGALLAQAMRSLQQADPALSAVAVQETACLFACHQHCTVHLRASGKIGYVLGRFTPTEEAARAILEYATLHAQSAEGVVPYGQWPEGVKGQFIARTPPEGFVCA